MLRTAVVAVAIFVGASPALSYDQAGAPPHGTMRSGVPNTPAAEEMIRRFDRDGDGKLDATELQVVQESRKRERLRDREGRPPRGDRRPRPEQFDLDADGRLSHDEATAFHQAIARSKLGRGLGMPTGPAMRTHRELDLNKDGTISQDEMRAYRERLEQ